MRVLTVLDSWKGKVYCYDVEGLVNEYEDYIESRGHMYDHCQWMVTDSLPAMYVPGIYYQDNFGEASGTGIEEE